MDGGGSPNGVEGGRKWVRFRGAARGIPVGTGVVSIVLVYIVYIVLRALQGVISKGRDGVALCYFSELHVKLRLSQNKNFNYKCTTLGKLLTSLSLRFSPVYEVEVTRGSPNVKRMYIGWRNKARQFPRTAPDTQRSLVIC